MREDGREEALGLWLRRVVAGDRLAFEKLFTWYQRDKRLLRYLSRMTGGDLHTAEELFSEVMVEVWKSAARFRGDAKPSTWIFSIAQHKAASAMRKKRLKVVPLEDAARTLSSGDSPEHIAEEHSLQKRIEWAMDKLTPDHRSVILLVVQGFHYKEIAKIVGCNEETVKTRTFYARKRLKKLLTEEIVARRARQ